MKEKEEETLHYKMLFAFPSGPPLNCNILSLRGPQCGKSPKYCKWLSLNWAIVDCLKWYLFDEGVSLYLCIWCLKMNSSVVGFQELFWFWLYRSQSNQSKKLTKAFEISMTLCLTRNQWRISKLERKSWKKGFIYSSCRDIGVGVKPKE